MVKAIALARTSKDVNREATGHATKIALHTKEKV